MVSRSFLTGDQEFWEQYIRGYKSKNPRLVAAAGRFLFLRYLKTLAVFYLKTKSGVTLPEHRIFKGMDSNTLVFGGDQNSGAFKVAVLALRGMPDQPPLGIYDSTTKTWAEEQFSYGLLQDKFECTILLDKLYILEPAHGRGAPFNLMALTLLKNGMSRELHIEEILEKIPNYPVDMVRSSLHANSSCLFMIACIKDKVLIWEVDLSTKKYIEIAQLPIPLTGMESIISTASDDCIFILVDDTRGFLYDLGLKTWQSALKFPDFNGNGMVGKKCDIFVAA